MSSKKASWMRVLAFTVMLTLVLMTGATGLVVAEDMEIMRGPGGPGGGGGPGGPGGPGETEKKASIMLEKTASVSVVHFMDETIEYYFTITNNGGKDLTDVILIDDDLNLEIAIGDLSKGSSYTTATAFNLNDAEWSNNCYRNTASVTGSAESKGKTVNVTDTDTVTIDYIPILNLEKTVTPNKVFFKDSIAEYTLTVTNQGCVDVSDIALVDGDLDISIPVGMLGPGEYFTTTAAVDLNQAVWEDDTFINHAAAQGIVMWNEEQRTVEAEAVAAVSYQPPLTLTKTVDRETVNFKDATVTYTFKVKNHMDEDLCNVMVLDETIGAVLDFGKVREGKWETRSFNFNLADVSWDGNDQFINTARVEAPFMWGDTPVTLSAVDTATVTYIPPMTLEKTVDPETVYSQDGIVNYTVKVWNNLPDKTIKNVVLTDPLLDLMVNAGDIKAKDKWNKGYYTTTVAIDLSLIPEEAWDGNQLTNEATATGCYEKIIWNPRSSDGDGEMTKHWKPPTECITLTAVGTATLTYDPTTLTIKKDVPNVTGSVEVFDVLISWEEEWIDDEDPGDSEIPQYRMMVMDTTTKSIQAAISELEPYIMDAVPGVLYTVTETTKAGYTTSEASFQITLEPGEDGVITFVNTKDVIEEETSGGGGTNQGGSSGGGGDTDTNTIATVPEGQVPLAQDPVTVETLADLPIPLADVPQTGNNALLNLWWMLLALSGLGIWIVVYRKSEKI